MHRYILISVIFTAIFASAAHAYDFTVGVVGGASQSPYRSSDPAWIALPYASFDSEYVYVKFPSAGVHIFDNDTLKIDFQLSYMPNEFKPGDSSHLGMKRLDKRYSSLGAGVDAELSTPLGKLSAKGVADVLGNSNGIAASLTYTYPFVITPRLMAGPRAGIFWESGKQNDYYYGVSNKESYLSGLRAYSPGGGFSYFAGGQVIFMFSQKLCFMLEGQYLFLSNEIKDSPMVDKSGLWMGSGGLLYTF